MALPILMGVLAGVVTGLLLWFVYLLFAVLTMGEKFTRSLRSTTRGAETSSVEGEPSRFSDQDEIHFHTGAK